MASDNASTKVYNEIARNDGQSSPAGELPISSKYAHNYLQDGNAYRSSKFPERLEFVDRKDRMLTFGRANQFNVRAMVDTAMERGWTSMDVRGNNPVFKSMAYVEATTRGIAVTGYQPNAKDHEAVERRSTREAANANPKVQAFMAAGTAAQQKAAIKQYPELKDAFAAQAVGQAAVKAAAPNEADRQQLLGALNDKIARRIHTGEPMPQIQVRSQHQLQEIERE
ncbi:hypothetical protein AE923_08875 [Xanthomonas arboricola]|uniref:LPD7 domain-containing protein n=1 Tax=Xanthomonas arboricola TaxID=56448 RepID=UPI00069E0B64|nr:LPD7 domain-containing protein [Xanthomonas arboricola]KOB09319.1 hypothetical protein AE923_08875 [Xanthomonas arboricola]